MDCEVEKKMDNGKGKNQEKMIHPVAKDYSAYVEGEESLLEQIRSKEGELSIKINAEQQACDRKIDAARKEMEEAAGRKMQAAQAEADAVWHEAMERIGTDIEEVRREGERNLLLYRKRLEKNFDQVVKKVVRTVQNG